MRRQFLVPSFVPVLLLLLGAWMMRPSQAADPKKPHAHRGLLEVRTLGWNGLLVWWVSGGLTVCSVLTK